MGRVKSVQIPEELFVRLYAYHVLDKRDALNAQIIRDGLEEKLERIQAHETYSFTLSNEKHGL